MIDLRSDCLNLAEKKEQIDKSKRDSQIKVVTCWDYTEEVPPAFKRLMMLLSKPRAEETDGKPTT